MKRARTHVRHTRTRASNSDGRPSPASRWTRAVTQPGLEVAMRKASEFNKVSLAPVFLPKKAVAAC